jgi:hypothetical protein
MRGSGAGFAVVMATNRENAARAGRVGVLITELSCLPVFVLSVKGV